MIAACDLVKRYDGLAALRGLSLTVGRGAFAAVVGPSGCGKTTLLKLLAGFEAPDSGRLHIDGRDMAGVSPAARPTRMMFQNLALFPHRTVAENIAFPLRMARRPRAEVARRTRAALARVHLAEAMGARYPDQVSGGERQRVALARALISEPAVLLLDEPLSALDANLKRALREDIRALHRAGGTSFVYVTHDLDEALDLADRVHVLRDGVCVQAGPPEDIYHRPADVFVATFTGDVNTLPVTVPVPVTVAGSAADRTVQGVGLPARTVPQARLAPGVGVGPAWLLVRPERLRFLAPADADAPWTLAGTVAGVSLRGGALRYRVNVPVLGKTLRLDHVGASGQAPGVGEAVRIGFGVEDIHVVPAGELNAIQNGMPV